VAGAGPTPFRFYDNRQKYLAFVTTCNEKAVIAARCALTDPPDEEAVFRYQMHTLPSEIGDRIGTSTLFAAWNAVIYVNQIEDDRLEPVLHEARYLAVTQEILHKYGALSFNDEAFVVARRHDR